MGICELGSDVEDEVLALDSQSQHQREKARKHNTRVTQSQALLHYFAKLARSDDVEEEIDIEFVDNLIQGKRHQCIIATKTNLFSSKKSKWNVTQIEATEPIIFLEISRYVS